MPKVTLYYFDFEGRAQPTRVALHHAGVDFEDVRVPFAEWKDRKATMLGGSMPVIEIDGVQINQSLAIGRWAGKQSSLYPEDPIVAVVVLTMAAMPPAQNLVLLTNLREETRHLAPRLAGLLLRMYVLAIPPTTAWLTVFTAAVA